MNPEYYYMVTRLFSSEDDKQQRSVVVLTKPDARLLPLFGVRYVISEKEIPSEQPANLIQQYRSGGNNSTAINIFLYELDNPNLGNYSPTKQLISSTAVDSIARIKDASFQPNDSVVLQEHILCDLEKANQSTMHWEDNGISVNAKSNGKSLLVLPLQFSNCLTIEQNGILLKSEETRLVRADIALTGILFTGNIEATIKYNFGIFNNPTCRIQDYFEERKMLLGADSR